MTICLVDIGKQPEEPLNVSMLLPLPADTPYGNFQLKWMDMLSRLNEANRQIIISHETWNATIRGDIEDSMKDVFNTHRFATEYAVIGLRRIADELVALIWCLEQLATTGEYPSKIKVDCLGHVFKQNYNGPDEIFARHLDLFRTLNDLSNTFKHSVIQSDLARIGADEPLILALNLKGANLESEPVFYNVSLTRLIEGYNQLFADCRNWLYHQCQQGRTHNS
ncbi:hypothetical protein [Pseudomonas sp. Xaverov 83]|uniref:hypothetical protein n=1 Tax=Pseudomonas sp. Xaverov 83 TaxID=2666087 RepID=UPI001C5B5838|nr:hypothetical protein [Pseudomonas sp. Xaverov 83]